MVPAGSAQDLRTLEFGPFWMLSAISGRDCGFEWLELESFWDTVERLSVRGGLSGQIMTAVSTHRTELLAAYEHDLRSVSTGICDVLRALRSYDDDDAHEYKRTVLEVGRSLATARGPFGRSMNLDDGQMLTLLAQLLEFGRRTVAA